MAIFFSESERSDDWKSALKIGVTLALFQSLGMIPLEITKLKICVSRFSFPNVILEERMKVILFGGLNRMVNTIPKSPVLCPFQLITGDNCNALNSVSFPHQSFDLRGEQGSIRVSNSPFLNRCMNVGYCYRNDCFHTSHAPVGLSICSIVSHGTSAMSFTKSSGTKFLYCLDSMIRGIDLGHVNLRET